MAIKRSEIIKCTCGGAEFSTLVTLIRHPGQGMSTKVSGYVCRMCSEKVDLERESKLAELRRRKAELEEVEMEIEEMETQNS